MIDYFFQALQNQKHIRWKQRKTRKIDPKARCDPPGRDWHNAYSDLILNRICRMSRAACSQSRPRKTIASGHFSATTDLLEFESWAHKTEILGHNSRSFRVCVAEYRHTRCCTLHCLHRLPIIQISTQNHTSFPITTLRMEFEFLAHFCMVAAEDAINRFSIASILAERGKGVSLFSTFLYST